METKNAQGFKVSRISGASGGVKDVAEVYLTIEAPGYSVDGVVRAVEAAPETAAERDRLRSENAELRKNDRRYRWLRDRLAIEDIQRLESEAFGYPFDEAESVKTDAAIDAALALTRD